MGKPHLCSGLTLGWLRLLQGVTDEHLPLVSSPPGMVSPPWNSAEGAGQGAAAAQQQSSGTSSVENIVRFPQKAWDDLEISCLLAFWLGLHNQSQEGGYHLEDLHWLNLSLADQSPAQSLPLHPEIKLFLAASGLVSYFTAKQEAICGHSPNFLLPNLHTYQHTQLPSHLQVTASQLIRLLGPGSQCPHRLPLPSSSYSSSFFTLQDCFPSFPPGKPS